MPEFFRFPQTPHLAWLGQGTPRDDKLLSPDEVRQLLASEVLVEEKLDGANLGFSIGPDGAVRAQNRGQYLIEPYGGSLPGWLPGFNHAKSACLMAWVSTSSLLANGVPPSILSNMTACAIGGCCLTFTTGSKASSGAPSGAMPGRSNTGLRVCAAYAPGV